MTNADLIRERLLRDLAKDPGILILAYPYARTWEPMNCQSSRQGWAQVGSNETGAVYVHLPFCRRKCTFCDFLAYYGRPGSEIEDYLDLLCQEIALVAQYTQQISINAIHLGGGTPSLLTPDQVERLLDELRNRLVIQDSIQATMEVFPAQIHRDQIRGWKRAGVNRVSYGIQFFDDELKRSVNRTDSTKENLQILTDSISAGFDDFNLDLMCGMPEQTMQSWEKTLRRATVFMPSHICIFPVSVRHAGIPLYKRRSQLPPPDETRRMWDVAVEWLKDKGYHRTTRHNFMRSGYKYRYEHMIANLAPLIPLGANSVGYSNNCIYRNHSDLRKYAAAVREGEWPVRAGYVFAGDDCHHNYAVRRIEYLALDGADFMIRFGKTLDEAFGEQIDVLDELGLATMTDGDLRLTEDGVYFTSAVKRALFHPDAWTRFESMKSGDLILERGTLVSVAVPARSFNEFREPALA